MPRHLHPPRPRPTHVIAGSCEAIHVFKANANEKEQAKEAVTFFEKKVTKKTLLLGEFWTGLPLIASVGGD